MDSNLRTETTESSAEPMEHTEAFLIREGEWKLLLDGEMVEATFNSKGAAEAAIRVERARRFRRVEKKMDDLEARINALRAKGWKITRHEDHRIGWEYVHDAYDGAPDSHDNRCGWGSLMDCIEAMEENETYVK